MIRKTLSVSNSLTHKNSYTPVNGEKINPNSKNGFSLAIGDEYSFRGLNCPLDFYPTITMFQIRTYNNIAPIGLDQFDSEKYQVSNDCPDPNAIVVRSANLHSEPIINENLLAVARAGAGFNNIPVEKLTQEGVVVFNTPGANANAVKELVIGAMLTSARNLHHAYVYTKELTGNAESMAKKVEQGKKKFAGIELSGRTLGVIGLGAIGVKVANAAIDLGMKVCCYDPGLTLSRAIILNHNVKRETKLHRVLEQAEFISYHVPLIESTRGIFNQKSLQAIQNPCVLMNFSRQGIIEEQAVLAGIAANKIRSYITDFPSERLLHEPRVLSFPHLGASTGEAEETCAIMAAEQLQQFIETGNIRNSVNFPHCELDPVENGARLVIANDNIPGMIEHISKELADAKLNIIDLLNQSLQDLAYNIIDVDGEINPETLQSLKNLKGIRKIRTCKA